MRKTNWFLIGCAILSIALLSYGRYVAQAEAEEMTDTTGGIIERSTSYQDSVIRSTGSTSGTFSTEATSPDEGKNPIFRNPSDRKEDRDSSGSTTSDTFTTSDTYNTGNTASTSSTRKK